MDVKTPICDFVKKYAESGNTRFHMPGHKGTSFLGAEKLDITEIDGADVLYNPSGIIKESEEIASSLFGTAKTLYSTEGSSLSIRAMLYLALLGKTSTVKRPVITAGRNAHKVFMTASALLDFDIDWLYPEEQESIVSCVITPDRLDKHLADTVTKPVAVYITSPDYLGNIADIEGLSRVCRKHGVLLLVDNAHGAYLRFLPKPFHPMDLGADMCCDSAHKTLPVLTGGAYLHISKSAPEYLCENAENAMSLFSSTSPSYLILQSLDMANRYLSDNYRDRLDDMCERVSITKARLTNYGYKLVGNEPLKISVAPKSRGLTGSELAEVLRAQNFICEFYDPDYTVMMITPENDTVELEKLEYALSALPEMPEITNKSPAFNVPERKMTPREALFATSEKLNINQCEGRVLASANVACPPAIPIVVCGEVIDESTVKLFEYYGINECCVVKQ